MQSIGIFLMGFFDKIYRAIWHDYQKLFFSPHKNEGGNPDRDSKSVCPPLTEAATFYSYILRKF